MVSGKFARSKGVDLQRGRGKEEEDGLKSRSNSATRMGENIEWLAGARLLWVSREEDWIQCVRRQKERESRIGNTKGRMKCDMTGGIGLPMKERRNGLKGVRDGRKEKGNSVHHYVFVVTVHSSLSINWSISFYFLVGYVRSNFLIVLRKYQSRKSSSHDDMVIQSSDQSSNQSRLTKSVYLLFISGTKQSPFDKSVDREREERKEWRERLNDKMITLT